MNDTFAEFWKALRLLWASILLDWAERAIPADDDCRGARLALSDTSAELSRIF